MKTLSKDDQATIETTAIDDKNVKVVHTVKPDKDSPVRYNLTWTFNFAGVLPRDILKLATRSLRIDMQRQWRESDDKLNESVWDNVTFNVAEILAGTRERSTNKVAKAEKLLSELSAEQLAELLAKHTKDDDNA